MFKTDTCCNRIIPKCTYIHSQIHIYISTHTDSKGLGDRSKRRRCCDAAKKQHSVFGHDYYSLFISVAAYEKIVLIVPFLASHLGSLPFLILN